MKYSLLLFAATFVAAASSSAVQFAGVNIAGFDFGAGPHGFCTLAYVSPPIASLGHADGAAQMIHFTSQDGMNMFRLPVCWQYLVNAVLGGPLDAANIATYDMLVQSCLATGAHCIIDIHNYARWDGNIVGQGGPTDAQLASVWGQLAHRYANQTKIVFGIMNEPHDLPSVSIWAKTVQASVTAIRTAGATSQMILLPGNGYTGASTFASGGSLAALSTVKNLDGSTKNLIFDVHKYLDATGAGSSPECASDNIGSAFQPLATALRAAGRQALLTETGGGNTASCEKDLCEAIAFLNKNTDVYLGYTGWAAGSFPTSYGLGETPLGNGTDMTDQPLVEKCLRR